MDRAKDPVDESDDAQHDAVAVIRALRAKARKGDVPAARELREWLARFGSEETPSSWLTLLDRDERHEVRRRITEGGRLACVQL